MCGICGFFNGGTLRLVETMADALVHRGPDDRGAVVRGPVGLGMTRLKIIDLDGGRQPMTNEDGSVVVVFNGEIYNYHELRAKLAARGHVFRTASDTEVLVHLYEDDGPACVTQLRGIFAFAIWDGRSLFLARDRLGVKPLYYTWHGGRFYFASEVKALLVCPGVEAAVDAEALDDLLTLQYVPAPKSLFRGIYKVPPGHWLKVNRRGAWVYRYWDLPASPGRAAGPRRVGEDVAALLAEAVQLRTIADVPLGALLSGGLDSSVVVALLRRHHAGPVKTFHIRFAGEEGEAAHARAVAAFLGCEHYELTAEPADLAELPRVIWHLDEPIADAAAWATYLICRYAKQHVTVLLTGEGGDEVFAGYPRYALSRLADFYRRGPGPFRSVVAAGVGALARAGAPGPWRHAAKVVNAARTPWERNVAWLSIFGEAARRSLYTDAFRSSVGVGRAARLYEEYYRAGARRSPVQRLTTADIKTWLADDVLMKADKASMAAAVEARVPLLDHKLVEYVCALPDGVRFGAASPKRLLKAASRGLVPAAIARRPKRAFVVPAAAWLRAYGREWVRDVVTSPRALARGYFEAAAVRRLVDDFDVAGAAANQVWTLFCLELWHRQFLDRPAPAPRSAAEVPCVISS